MSKHIIGYIIVNWWYDGSTVNVVIDEDGEAMKFSSREEAERYGKEELNGHFEVIGLTVGI